MESTLWTRVPKNMMEWKSLLSNELLPFQSCVSLYTSTENWRWSYFVWKNIEISFKRKCVLVSNLYRQVAKCKMLQKVAMAFLQHMFFRRSLLFEDDIHWHQMFALHFDVACFGGMPIQFVCFKFILKKKISPAFIAL